MFRKTDKVDGSGYSISQMCKLTGYTADTLCFYEKAGLLLGDFILNDNFIQQGEKQCNT